ncbi:zeta toxin family protein [Streptomyces albus]
MTLRLLDPASPPPYRPDRVLVAGGSGAGKTTVARKLAALFELDHIDLDALYYRPGWQPREEFPDDVERLTRPARWITEWHYPEVARLLARRAQLLVWLDYSVPLTMTSLLLRTLLRSLHRVCSGAATRNRRCARSSPTPRTSCATAGPPGT